MADGSDPTDGTEDRRPDELALEPGVPPTATRARALWGVLAVVAVAAGALAVASGGGDDAPRLPVGLGASGQREAAGAMAADMSLAWITYVAGDDLPSLGGEGAAYRVVSDVDAVAVADLVAALGLDGAAVRDGSSWRLEADGAFLEVDGASGSWWYTANSGGVVSGGSASGGGAAGCEPGPAVDCAFSEVGTAVEDLPATTVVECQGGDDCLTTEPVRDPCPPEADCVVEPVPECPPEADCIGPETTIPSPVDLPSEVEARRIALDLLSRTGLDVDDAEVTVDGPYDAWYVTVEPRLGGLPVSGWMANVGVGSRGVVTASGTLASAERVGAYPLLDTRAAIERLNELQGVGFGGVMPMEAGDRAVASDSGTASAGVAAAQCAAPPGSATSECNDTVVCEVQPDGSTVCDDDAVDPAPTTTVACKVQPDGREICEVPPVTECLTTRPLPAPEPACPSPPECFTTTLSPEAVADGAAIALVEPCIAPCVGAVPPAGSGGPDETVTTIADDPCVAPEPVPYPEPVPLPEPEPTEVVLTEAERVLVLSPAVDGSSDLYLVPGYRFSNADGHRVEVVAVADDSLAPTTIPEPLPEPGQITPGECEVLEEQDASGTTHTIQTCVETTFPPPDAPQVLPPGQDPEIGVGYYVDVDVECAAFELAGKIWRHMVGDLPGWSLPHEGGTFTLDSPTHGTFVGDAGGDKTATFETGTDPEGCTPTPRR